MRDGESSHKGNVFFIDDYREVETDDFCGGKSEMENGEEIDADILNIADHLRRFRRGIFRVGLIKKGEMNYITKQSCRYLELILGDRTNDPLKYSGKEVESANHYYFSGCVLKERIGILQEVKLNAMQINDKAEKYLCIRPGGFEKHFVPQSCWSYFTYLVTPDGRYIAVMFNLDSNNKVCDYLATYE